MSKSNKDTSSPKPYEGLADKELTPEQVAQRDHNLVRFVEFLIKLDKQNSKKLIIKNSRESSRALSPLL